MIKFNYNTTFQGRAGVGSYRGNLPRPTELYAKSDPIFSNLTNQPSDFQSLSSTENLVKVGQSFLRHQIRFGNIQ